ncbi:MAG: type II toxin-antitoxin system mRNA interferase toxin, RelE/StbE family [Patescibacteria group bacterium]
MLVSAILYHPAFVRDVKKLDKKIVERAGKMEKVFRANPLHPSLRLHQLKGSLQGLWSMSITEKIRIIFSRMDNGDIVFLSIGHHDIYRSW